MPSTPSAASRGLALACFVLAVLGFSFWFFLAVPFASHRETYWWLATVGSHDFGHAFSFISSTWRPVHQSLTWIGYLLLDPALFPTSPLRQAAFQLFVWAVFALAWWLICRAAAERRTLAVVACIAGAVFFSGYVHLFHVYGMSYFPVMLMIGGVLGAGARGGFERHEAGFAAVAAALVVWHPFATALFTGWYFGRALETWRQRDTAGRARAVAIIFACAATVVGFVFLLPRLLPQTSALLVETAMRGAGSRMLSFLVSYQTNEVHRIASVVALLLALGVAGSLAVSSRARAAAALGVVALAGAFVSTGWPLVLLWVLAALAKLVWMRRWSVACLGATAAILPFGGGIGSPIHALFAIIVAVYATALGWSDGERRLSAVVGPRSVAAAAAAVVLLVVAMRFGVDLPVLTRLATPLLAERERTYQGEALLAWLHRSPHCDRDIEFVAASGNPVDSVDSAIDRRFRPPASMDDMQLYWRTALQCRRGDASAGACAPVVLTFGGLALSEATPVFEVPGRYAGPATVWLRDRCAKGRLGATRVVKPLHVGHLAQPQQIAQGPLLAHR